MLVWFECGCLGRFGLKCWWFRWFTVRIWLITQINEYEYWPNSEHWIESSSSKINLFLYQPRIYRFGCMVFRNNELFGNKWIMANALLYNSEIFHYTPMVCQFEICRRIFVSITHLFTNDAKNIWNRRILIQKINWNKIFTCLKPNKNQATKPGLSATPFIIVVLTGHWDFHFNDEFIRKNNFGCDRRCKLWLHLTHHGNII